MPKAKPKKAGAPKGNTNASKGADARTALISVRVTEDEKATIERACKVLGKSLHELLIKPATK